LLALSLLTVGFCSPQYRALAALPDHIYLPKGDALELRHLKVFGHRDRGGVHVLRRAYGLQLVASGQGRLALTLGGLPLKRVDVRVGAQRRVLLGGQAIGVTVRGASTVVALDRVPTIEGHLRYPGGSAGLRVGDALLAVDGHAVRSDADLSELVQKAGKTGRSVRLTVLREDGFHTLKARPVFDRQLACYRLGVYVRDALSGVGTLTFADPAGGTFAALGHAVRLAAGASLSPKGEIAPAVVFGVMRARRGRPGQKLGALDLSQTPLGRITRNADVGIGGRLQRVPRGHLVPIATVSEVQTGPATLYTVLHGHKVESFAVRIDRIIADRRAGSKGMVLRIVDQRLLRRSGGIVQGMSGSPITQRGRLVGAVTHVFVHDPWRGYATFAEWMDEALCSPAGRIVRQPARPRADRKQAAAPKTLSARGRQALERLGAGRESRRTLSYQTGGSLKEGVEPLERVRE